MALVSVLPILATLLACTVLGGCQKSEESQKNEVGKVELTTSQERAHRKGLVNAHAMIDNAALCEPQKGAGDQGACERACELNHSNSCANWGRFLAASEPEYALELYRRACRGGSGIGCEAEAALALKAGQIDSADLYLNARRYHRVHCSQGYARSCSQLGRLYHLGLGGKVDEPTGRSYRQKSCQLGISSDC